MNRIVILVVLLFGLVVCNPSYAGWQFLGRGFDIAFTSLRPLDIDSCKHNFV
jgi:hypothetical protein